MAKPKRLGIGDKCTISGDPVDLGLNERKSQSNKVKLRGETSEMKQQPERVRETVKSDRGTFTCKH